MTIKEIEDKGLLLFKTLSGSRAYGTNKPTSDFDYRGVYILPIENLLGFNYIDQVNDLTNDITYYELGRFLQLLGTQNPNIIELFNMPEENIIYKHPMFEDILQHRDKFLSKVCKDSFGGYAIQQIKKARGLNKKIVNPVEKERKSILDFCYVIQGYQTEPLLTFIGAEDIDQKYSGLVKIDHARDVYSLFYDSFGDKGYKGIVNDDDTSNDVRLSSVEKGQHPIATLVYNKDGYTKYCKDYKEYWNWVEKRNDDRYQTNQEHGKGYDSKNMMHCIRLTRMAVEIAEQKKVIVKRPDAEELLKIRNGDAEYDDLLREAESTITRLDELYNNSGLPDQIDPGFVSDLLTGFRKKYYNI
jgi:hypothetical protein